MIWVTCVSLDLQSDWEATQKTLKTAADRRFYINLLNILSFMDLRGNVWRVGPESFPTELFACWRHWTEAARPLSPRGRSQSRHRNTEARRNEKALLGNQAALSFDIWAQNLWKRLVTKWIQTQLMGGNRQVYEVIWGIHTTACCSSRRWIKAEVTELEKELKNI